MFTLLNNIKKTASIFIAFVLLSGMNVVVHAELSTEILTLDENCVVNVLNRTVQADKFGGYALPNVPSFMGQIRARATCTRNGLTESGETEYFTIIENELVKSSKFYKEISNVPESISLLNGTRIALEAGANTVQLLPFITFPNGDSKIIRETANGINYNSSNPQIASVDSLGLLTGKVSGTTLIVVRIDGVLTASTVVVTLSGDSDGDGIPDDIELQFAKGKQVKSLVP